VARNVAKKQQLAPLRPVSGQPMEHPGSMLSLTPAGGALQPLHPVATGPAGETIPALGTGAQGTLRMAGRP
jgi:hypothetical protein